MVTVPLSSKSAHLRPIMFCYDVEFLAYNLRLHDHDFQIAFKRNCLAAQAVVSHASWITREEAVVVFKAPQS